MPPRGWDVPETAARAHDELDELVRLLGTLRGLLPPEVRLELAELARRLLLLVRAVVDWWLVRLERVEGARPASGPGQPIEDIPIG